MNGKIVGQIVQNFPLLHVWTFKTGRANAQEAMKPCCVATSPLMFPSHGGKTPPLFEALATVLRHFCCFFHPSWLSNPQVCLASETLGRHCDSKCSTLDPNITNYQEEGLQWWATSFMPASDTPTVSMFTNAFLEFDWNCLLWYW